GSGSTECGRTATAGAGSGPGCCAWPDRGSPPLRNLPRSAARSDRTCSEARGDRSGAAVPRRSARSLPFALWKWSAWAGSIRAAGRRALTRVKPARGDVGNLSTKRSVRSRDPQPAVGGNVAGSPHFASRQRRGPRSCAMRWAHEAPAGTALIAIRAPPAQPPEPSSRSTSGRAMQQAVTETYNDKVVRQFAVMTVVWGIVGMAVGVLIAAQLYWPDLTKGISWLSYGRLRPLHTNAVIFAFGGSALFATSLHVVQRTCH